MKKIDWVTERHTDRTEKGLLLMDCPHLYIDGDGTLQKICNVEIIENEPDALCVECWNEEIEQK